MRVGVEVGGTFTDLVAIDGENVVIKKVPSTPKNPDIGAFDALQAAAIDVSQVTDLAHGSTIATNAVLERKGARVAFVTTRGFRDVLLLQRHDRRQIYDLTYRKPRPVVQRSDCFEVTERIAGDGDVVTPLDEHEVVSTLIPTLRQGDYDAIAICLLGSYANPEHEVRLAALLRRYLQETLITCSSDVSREFREYERASTTTLAAYVQPVIDRYISRFSERLYGTGFKGRFSIMQSNGGRLPADGMRRNAITALFSGPAAGVIGAIRQAARSGFNNLITFDMGGTSTDVCLVVNGRPHLASETEIDGLPVRTPVLDIVTVGAGGGSIVWSDEGGMLRVGPHSAGANPGPACYALGGNQPTITDAHVIRGTIRPQAFLGGTMNIDFGAARSAYSGLCAQFGMTPEEIADSAIRLAHANIVRAIQLISTERGRDPRDYVLVPYGGAGPLAAAEVAEELGVDVILIPPHAGVLSAFGLLAADYMKMYGLTKHAVVHAGVGDLVREVFAELKARAETEFRNILNDEQFQYSFTVDMRFVGQAFEVPVDLTLKDLPRIDKNMLLRRFREEHQRIFFHGADEERPVEIVAFRFGIANAPHSVPLLTEPRSSRAYRNSAKLFERNQWQECTILSSAALLANESVMGPALIESYTSTTYLPAGWRGTTDDCSNLIMRRALSP